MKKVNVNYSKATKAEKRILSAIQNDETLFCGKDGSDWKRHAWMTIKPEYFSNSQGHFKVYRNYDKILEVWQLDADEWKDACKMNASTMWA